MNNKITALALKLQALAEKGVGGEKLNAEQALLRLLKKYNLTLEQLEEENQTVTYCFEWLKRDQLGRNSFFVKVLQNVVGDFDSDGREWGVYQLGRQSFFEIKVTPAERVEIEAKSAFYWNDYKTQLETYQTAYFIRNELFTKGATLSWEECSPEQLKQRRRAERMGKGIERKTYRKQLNPGKK